MSAGRPGCPRTSWPPPKDDERGLTNAVVHGRNAVTAEAVALHAGLRVKVTDDGEGLPRAVDGTTARFAVFDAMGHGLSAG
jgi:anti-sigma regulatory factor (Ser/Thr protein kinase)